MALTPTEAAEKASELYELKQRERKRLDTIRMYLKGKPEITYLPASAPRELQALAQMARIPLMDLIIKATTQQMFVDGYTAHDQAAADRVWATVWQSNRWGRKQIALHRSTAGYGAAFGSALLAEGDNAPPVLRAHSPRQMTASYGSDEDWPDYALEQRRDGTWWLLDETSVYDLRKIKAKRGRPGEPTIVFAHVADSLHHQDVTPVVRYLADEDLDDPVQGDVEPNMTLQDQVNLCSLHLLTAQHLGASGRKILVGQMMSSIEKQLSGSASSTLTINAKPEDFKVEELSQTQLDGFIESREASARFAAAISQTPTHELLGTLSNLAATALLEARESTARKVNDRKVVVGESHEQLLGQAGTLMADPMPLDPSARVRWKPVIDSRTLHFVETLALMAEKLGVPERELWRETPFPDSTLASWAEARDEMDARGQENTAVGQGADGEAPTPNLAAL